MNLAGTLRNKILIIEDDPGICTFLKTTLTASGYDSLTASDGKSALQIISS